MKPFAAFLKKEFLEAFRTGRLAFLLLLFVLMGVMNPAIAKLTPWLMEMFAGSIAESGLIVTAVQVDAMTSWTQFFKNIPMALIAFVLLYGDTFTREYKSGALLLILTKGLSGTKVLLAKGTLLLSLWTAGYWLCFAVTYVYNAFFWDNSVAVHLFPASLLWWLFGIWVVCLAILFSALLRGSAEVILCTGGTVLLSYLLCFFQKVRAFMPSALMGSVSLLSGAEGPGAFQKAAVAAAVISVLCIAAAIPAINKKQL